MNIIFAILVIGGLLVGLALAFGKPEHGLKISQNQRLIGIAILVILGIVFLWVMRSGSGDLGCDPNPAYGAPNEPKCL